MSLEPALVATLWSRNAWALGSRRHTGWPGPQIINGGTSIHEITFSE